MKKTLTLLLTVLLLPIAFAETGHITLVAVSETEGGHVGSTADLFLDTKPGSGRIFLETFPFTKVDTQMSTRFANEVVCDRSDVDCTQFDYFYSITAESVIIAGPSAGAALAVLTTAMIEDLSLDESVTITGTINSGGIVGPVGGLKEKIQAADEAGLKKILIPFGEVHFDQDNNTLDLHNITKGLDIEVVEVATLDQAVFHFTGKPIKQREQLEINPKYTQTMAQLAQQLCERAEKLEGELHEDINESQLTNYNNLSQQSQDAFAKEQYYSAASFCYGANVELSTLQFRAQNLSKKEVDIKTRELQSKTAELRATIQEYDIKTITDLEAYMIVNERLDEAQSYIDNLKNGTNHTASQLAWATERVQSAFAWAEFLGKEGKAYTLNKNTLAASCTLKLSEVQERIHYVEEFFPFPLQSVREEYKAAKQESEKGNFELCLFKASKAKARVGVILGVFGVRQESYSDVLSTKLGVVHNDIAQAAQEGTFPILGYSYLEYATALQDEDSFSSLLYAEYALELGNLDMYFDNDPKPRPQKEVDSSKFYLVLIGIFIGILSGLVIAFTPRTIKKRK